MYAITNGTETVHVEAQLMMPEADRLSEGRSRKITIVKYDSNGTETVVDGGHKIDLPSPKIVGFKAPTTNVERNAAPVVEVRSTFEKQVMNEHAVSAVKADHALLSELGFALPKVWFPIGTALAESGVVNFTEKKRVHENAPTIRDAMVTLYQKVKAESRRDQSVSLNDLRMTAHGTVFREANKQVALTEAAFAQLASRMGLPGGSAYLRACWPALRATNFNAWAESDKIEKAQAKLRLRNGNEGPEVYAVVSDSYGACDADTIAKCVAEAFTEYPDARAHVAYDGIRTVIEAEFMSDIKPEHATVGEVWRASVKLRSNDVGGGSISGSGGVSMALCLNFTTADATGETFSIRHIGSPSELIRKLKRGIEKSLGQIQPLVTQWGYACKADVLAQISKEEREGFRSLSPQQSLRWLFSGIVERELVPVHGRKRDALDRLMDLHEGDRSSARAVHNVSRASITNAFTAYAHNIDADPWERTEIERAAGKLLWSTKSLPTFDPQEL